MRADHLPLVLRASGAAGLARGSRVRVRLGDIDEVALDLTGTVIERLDALAGGAADEENDDDAVAGPLSIAVDLSEPDSPAPSPETAAS